MHRTAPCCSTKNSLALTANSTEVGNPRLSDHCLGFCVFWGLYSGGGSPRWPRSPQHGSSRLSAPRAGPWGWPSPLCPPDCTLLHSSSTRQLRNSILLLLQTYASLITQTTHFFTFSDHQDQMFSNTFVIFSVMNYLLIVFAVLHNQVLNNCFQHILHRLRTFLKYTL